MKTVIRMVLPVWILWLVSVALGADSLNISKTMTLLPRWEGGDQIALADDYAFLQTVQVVALAFDGSVG